MTLLPGPAGIPISPSVKMVTGDKVGETVSTILLFGEDVCVVVVPMLPDKSVGSVIVRATTPFGVA